MEHFQKLTLTSSQKLALLHTITVLASIFSEDFSSGSRERFFVILLLTCAGFLMIVFQMLPQERAMISISKEKEAISSRVQPDLFAVKITDMRIRNNKTEYRLDFLYQSTTWSCWLRYSALRVLAQSAGSMDAFPPKSSLVQTVWHSDAQLDFIAKRRLALQSYVSQVLFPTKSAFEILLNTEPTLREVLAVPESVQISKESGKQDRKTMLQFGLTSLQMVEDQAHFAKQGQQGGNGWTFHSHRDGIDCFLKKDGNLTHAMGRGPMTVSAQRALEFMLNLTYRKTWDEMFKFQHVVEQFKEYDFAQPETGNEEWEVLSLQIAHSAFISPTSMVAERDSVSLGIVGRRIKDGALCVALRSVEDARVPEGKDGYVRAKIQLAGFLFEHVEGKPEECIMTTMGMVDPNGNIPQFVVNIVAPKRAFTIKDINTACLKVPA